MAGAGEAQRCSDFQQRLTPSIILKKLPDEVLQAQLT
jgi:hypothetical protein